MSVPAAAEEQATSSEEQVTVSLAQMQIADRRPGPPPELPPPDKLFCPYQNSVNDLQVHIFDIANGKYGLKGYLGTLSAMNYRQLRWSPFTINGIPVTPLRNPKSGSSSFFIIRLIDSRNPRYKVDLLIRDVDLYFVGFRRELVLDPEEEAQRNDNEEGTSSGKKHKSKKLKAKEAARAEKKAAMKETSSGWGWWHRFNDEDLKLPSFFNARKCGIYSTYRKGVTAGGSGTFEEILNVLGSFDDGYIATEDLQRACFSVMVMICEASRIRAVFREMLFRIVNDCGSYEVGVRLMSLINNWKHMGGRALGARFDGHMALTESLDQDFIKKMSLLKCEHELKTLGDLIDQHSGELMLIKWVTDYSGYTESEICEIANQAKVSTNGPADRFELDFTHEAM